MACISRKTFPTFKSSRFQYVPSRDFISQNLGFVILAACFAGIQFLLIKRAFQSSPEILAYYASQVVEGTPDLRIYQSRVLGPYAVEGLHQMTGWKFSMCYDIITFLLLSVFFFILIHVSYSLWKSTIVILCVTAVAGFLNAILMQGPLLCLWDHINLIIFTIIVWALTKGKSLWFIAIPLVVGIFNHEIILIATGWIALDAIFVIRNQSVFWPQLGLRVRWCPLISSLLLLITGFIVIEILRDSLLIFAVDEIEGTSISGVGGLAWFVLPENFEALRASFATDPESHNYLIRHFGTKFTIIYTPVIFGILVICIKGIFSDKEQISRCSILFLILWISTFTFGWIYETRIWLIFVPYIVLVLPQILAGNMKTTLESQG